MDVDKRMKMIRLCEGMKQFPEMSKRMCLEDHSTYHGRRMDQERNTLPLSEEEPA